MLAWIMKIYDYWYHIILLCYSNNKSVSIQKNWYVFQIEQSLQPTSILHRHCDPLQLYIHIIIKFIVQADFPNYHASVDSSTRWFYPFLSCYIICSFHIYQTLSGRVPFIVWRDFPCSILVSLYIRDLMVGRCPSREFYTLKVIFFRSTSRFKNSIH